MHVDPALASQYRGEVLDDVPAPLPASVVEALGRAASTLPDVVAVYLVLERRAWSNGRSQLVRALQLVVRDAPEDEPLSSDRGRPIVAEMAAALTRGGQVDVSIGITAPRFVPVVQARGSLLWSRESA